MRFRDDVWNDVLAGLLYSLILSVFLSGFFCGCVETPVTPNVDVCLMQERCVSRLVERANTADLSDVPEIKSTKTSIVSFACGQKETSVLLRATMVGEMGEQCVDATVLIEAVIAYDSAQDRCTMAARAMTYEQISKCKPDIKI